MLKVLVIGLDGATFGLLNPWIEDGSLPMLRKMITGGTHAVMDSCLPPVTCPNWKCYSTGKEPGKLGVYWWEIVDVKNRTIESVRYADHVRSREIWDFMNAGGYRTAVINMPTTYPPKEINGCMIAGGPDCPNENFTYPEELEKEIKERFNYRVHLEGVGRLSKRDKRAVSEVKEHIRQTFDVTRYIMSKGSYDFVHMTIFCTSIVQHFLWDDDIAKEVWGYLDREIDNLCSEIPEECGVILMSDHGMRRVSREFYINRWLEEEGYLTLKKGNNAQLNIKPSYKKGVGGMLKALGIDKGLGKIPYLKRLSAGMGASSRGIIKEEKAKVIDWDRSKVIASGQGPVYLIDNNSKYYEKLRDEIIGRLKGLKDPQTGRPLAAKVYKREEVYHNIISDNAPDIVLVPEAGYRINGEIKETHAFVDCHRWAAENDQPGIFIAYGKDIREALRPSRISITDLAPTIHHWMDIPVPDDMDGRVLKEIFKEDSGPYKREIKKREGDDVSGVSRKDYDEGEEEMVRKRLRELGYMDG